MLKKNANSNARIKDVAQYGGVSVSSVSRYLNAPDTLRLETRKKIQKAVETLRYSPNPIARSLRTKSTETIALIIPSLDNLYYVDLYSELRQAAAASGYTINLLTSNWNCETMRKYLQVLPNRNVDGIIVTFLDDDELIEDFRVTQKYIPLVLVTSTPNRQEFNSIFIDAQEGVSRATQHLIDSGCTRIAFVGGRLNGSTLAKRKGFEIAMRQNSLSVNPEFYFFDKDHFSTGFWAMRQFWNLNKRPDGIVCTMDDIAMGCVKYLLRNGLKIPQDVKVIGFNGISLINAYEPSISSLEHPIKAIASEAVNLVRKQIESPRAKRHQVTLYTTLIVNTSTDVEAPTRFLI